MPLLFLPGHYRSFNFFSPLQKVPPIFLGAVSFATMASESTALSCATEVHDSLSQANTELEKMWESVVSLSDLAQTPEISQIACRRLVSYNPTNPVMIHTLPHLSKAIDALGQIVAARGTQLQSDPTNPEHYVVLGHCYLLLNDFPNAFTAYSHVLRLGPPVNSPFFHYAAGAVFQHFKYYRDSQEQLLVALRQGAHPMDLRLRLAFVNRGLGECESALSSLDLVLQSTLPPMLTHDDIHFQVAYTHQLAGHVEKADHIYNDLYKRHPNTIEVLQQYCWFLSLQSDKPSFDRAERIMQQSGQSGEPMLRLAGARIAMKLQDMTLAYQRYCDCITFWTDSPLFWCGLGVLYFRNDQMQDAIVAFQRALYLRSELVDAWANLGLIFEMQRDHATAVAVYQQGIQACGEKDSKLLKERMAALNGGRFRSPAASQIIELNESPFFVQVAERVAMDIVATPPPIPAKHIGIDASLEGLIAEMVPPHKSLF
jgi:tetratricopeptide (TPR) repeat protein